MAMHSTEKLIEKKQKAKEASTIVSGSHGGRNALSSVTMGAQWHLPWAIVGERPVSCWVLGTLKMQVRDKSEKKGVSSPTPEPRITPWFSLQLWVLENKAQLMLGKRLRLSLAWLISRFFSRQVRWSDISISLRIFQFVVIHRVKGFSVINEAEFFLEFPCFFYDPMDVGNLISGSFAFPKSHLYI